MSGVKVRVNYKRHIRKKTFPWSIFEIKVFHYCLIVWELGKVFSSGGCGFSTAVIGAVRSRHVLAHLPFNYILDSCPHQMLSCSSLVTASHQQANQPHFSAVTPPPRFNLGKWHLNDPGDHWSSGFRCSRWLKVVCVVEESAGHKQVGNMQCWSKYTQVE